MHDPQSLEECEEHRRTCPVCSDQPPPDIAQLRQLLQACRPVCCPPSLKARIVREVRFVALTFKEINQSPGDPSSD